MKKSSLMRLGFGSVGIPLMLGVIWLAAAAPRAASSDDSAVPTCAPRAKREHPKNMVRPAYPQQALQAGVEGTVQLSAVVGADGTTKDLRVTNSVPLLDASAVEAVHQWRFHPAMVSGERVEATYEVHVVYVLKKKDVLTWLKRESPPEPRGPGEITGDPPAGVYRVGPGITPPKAIYSPSPEFSGRAREKKEQGTVMSALIVGEDGKTRDVRAVCSDYPDLVENTVETIKTWKFTPAMKDGNPVMVQVVIETSFHQF
jgi:TonB family protein